MLARMLGFLHTAGMHVATFEALLQGLDPSLPTRHAVRDDLLAAARVHGPQDPAVRAGVEEAVRSLIAAGAGVVLCTCSTIAGAAEQVEVPTGVAILRVDRPMAERAVEVGRRIAVVAALAATLAPTRELLRAAAARVPRAIEVTEVLCDDAWTLFERGDVPGYLDAIATAARRAAAAADVVVLAQASMAPVADRLGAGPVPVLSSPRLGVEAAVRTHRARSRGPA
jgi:aspartate/glutamate racemase